MFLSATLDAAIHHGEEGGGYLEKFHSTKNQSQRTMKQLFDVTKKLIIDQTWNQGISKIDWHTHMLDQGQLC